MLHHAQVLHAVAAKLQVPFSAQLSLQMEGIGATVTAPAEMSANDRFVLVGADGAAPAYAEK